MRIILGARRGVECNLDRSDWSTSYAAARHSLTAPLYFENFAHTPLSRVGSLVDIDRRWKISRNSEKCGKMCIRIWSMGDGPAGVEFQLWGSLSISTSRSNDPGAHCVDWDFIGDLAKMNKKRKNVNKCASHSARAGESNATFIRRIGPLPTQPRTQLRLRPHHIGFCSKTSRTHTRGCVFRSTSYRRWKIRRNSEKCGKMCVRRGARGWPGWCRFSESSAFIVSHTHVHPNRPHTAHCPTHRPGGSFCGCAKMNKNRKKCEQMCVTLGACRGVGCIHHRASWTTSHPAALHSLPPRPPRWVFTQTSHTPVPGPFLVEIDRG